MKVIMTIDNEHSATMLYHFIKSKESAQEQLSMWSFVSTEPAEFVSFKCSAFQCILEEGVFKIAYVTYINQGPFPCMDLLLGLFFSFFLLSQKSNETEEK